MVKWLAGLQRERVRLRSDRGVSAVEYGLILALFALAVVAGSSLLFQGMRASYVGASNDVGTPRQPTQAPSNTAVPDPPSDPPETPPAHVPVVAPDLTRTVICSSTPVDVNIRTSLLPIQNATVLVASHPDADVVDSSRVIRYTPDTATACNSTVTIPYTFSYRDAGVFYTDGTGNLLVTVLKPAIAVTQTESVWCSPTALATFDLSAVLAGWPSASITSVSDNGGATASRAGTTVTYDPVTSGSPNDCGDRVTINYTFSYVVGGVTYSDGTGQLRVDVSDSCDLSRKEWTLGNWSNRGYTSATDNGAPGNLRLATSQNDPLRYRYLRYTPTAAECGTSVRIDYQYVSRPNVFSPFTTGSGSVAFDVRP